MAHVQCGCGSRCGVAFACGAASVPVAVVCIVAARAAMARMRFCRGKELSIPIRNSAFEIQPSISAHFI